MHCDGDKQQTPVVRHPARGKAKQRLVIRHCSTNHPHPSIHTQTHATEQEIVMVRRGVWALLLGAVATLSEFSSAFLMPAGPKVASVSREQHHQVRGDAGTLCLSW